MTLKQFDIYFNKMFGYNANVSLHPEKFSKYISNNFNNEIIVTLMDNTNNYILKIKDNIIQKYGIPLLITASSLCTIKSKKENISNLNNKVICLQLKNYFKSHKQQISLSQLQTKLTFTKSYNLKYICINFLWDYVRIRDNNSNECYIIPAPLSIPKPKLVCQHNKEFLSYIYNNKNTHSQLQNEMYLHFMNELFTLHHYFYMEKLNYINLLIIMNLNLVFNLKKNMILYYH